MSNRLVKTNLVKLSLEGILYSVMHYTSSVVKSMQMLLGRRPKATRHIASVWCQIEQGHVSYTRTSGNYAPQGVSSK